MHHRPFGKHGFHCSEIGFGGWAIGGSWGTQSDADSLAALNRALDLGCNFVDTAAGYGDGRSEKIIAQALRDRAARTGKNEKIFVATKTPPCADHAAQRRRQAPAVRAEQFPILKLLSRQSALQMRVREPQRLDAAFLFGEILLEFYQLGVERGAFMPVVPKDLRWLD